MGIFHSFLWLIRLSVKYWHILSTDNSFMRLRLTHQNQEEILLFLSWHHATCGLIHCFCFKNQIAYRNKLKPSKRILYVTVEIWQVRLNSSSCVFKYSSRRVESSLVSRCSNEWPTFSGFIEVSILSNDSFVEKMEDLGVTQGCLCEGDKLPPCDQ